MFAHCSPPSCNHSIFFAVADQKCHFEISKYFSQRWKDCFNLLFLSGFQPFILFPSKSPGPRSKLGDFAAKVDGSCNDEGVKLAIEGGFQAEMLSKATSTISACSTDPSQWLQTHTHTLVLLELRLRLQMLKVGTFFRLNENFPRCSYTEESNYTISELENHF